MIGWVGRSNRRRVINEDAVLDALREIAVVRVLDMGVAGYETSVRGIQDVSVMVGMQGSGLINGLYLRDGAAVVVLYQVGGWDVFSEYLAPRGPYFWWANGNASSSYCAKGTDPYCDSPDEVLDAIAVRGVVAEALQGAMGVCNKGQGLG